MEEEERATPLPQPPHSQGWIVSPVFDLLFLANLGWPLLLLARNTQGDTSIDFWQIYFLSLPHRWVTMVLVLTDSDRRDGRGWKLTGIAVLSAAIVIGAYFGTGAFLCLALVDYVWNAWHFGSQHAGVLRMYARKVGGGSPWLERWGLRGFVTYAGVRAAAWATGAMKADPDALYWLHAVDFAVLLIPIAMLLSNLAGAGRERLGKLAYLSSVCLLYTGMVLSQRFGWARLFLVFIASGSMFHAIEYLAIVTHYARRRETVGSDSRFRVLARHWLVFLGLYILILGSAGAWMARPDSGLLMLWVGLNLWASFVHYAYDGMIWKLRRPATAAALGVGTP
ncbi:MAG: hypothetical protein ACJ8FY_23880 [Gemmataceae bacterium]